MPTSPRPPFAGAGETTSFVAGSKYAHESYEDDGDTLICRLDAQGTRATEHYSRSARTVRIEQGATTVVRHVPEGAIALENFCWQQYVIAAEEYPRRHDPERRSSS